MSQENVEIARQAVEQWRRGGATLDALPVEVYAEDVEWDQSAATPLDGPPRGIGLDGLRAVLENWLSSWTTYDVEPKKFIDAGDDVVNALHEKATGDGGVRVERDLFQVCTFRKGLVVRWRLFETRDEAVEAAGRRE